MTTPRSSGWMKTNPALTVVRINEKTIVPMVIETAPFIGFARAARTTARAITPTTNSHDKVANPCNALAIFIHSPFVAKVRRAAFHSRQYGWRVSKPALHPQYLMIRTIITAWMESEISRFRRFSRLPCRRQESSDSVTLHLSADVGADKRIGQKRFSDSSPSAYPLCRRQSADNLLRAHSRPSFLRGKKHSAGRLSATARCGKRSSCYPSIPPGAFPRTARPGFRTAGSQRSHCGRRRGRWHPS